ncbi:hypothetical protein ACFXAZ_12250 [Streptomyces sp. NPDC059477]|uniref:hypothetical protein n=1 Tax=Streptomyces sp. NPDC059477 TaxID=3346847 RepID=UPI0036A9B1E0
MARTRLLAASALLALAALGTTAAAATPPTGTVQAADIGWGRITAGANSEPNTGNPLPADNSVADIGWG